MHRILIFAAAMSVGAFGVASAWSANDEQIEACRKSDDRVQRLNCFDQLFRVDVPSPSPAAPVAGRPASPIRSLSLSQERGRGGATEPVVRFRPWGSDIALTPAAFAEATEAALRAPAATGHGVTSTTVDVFVSVQEKSAPLDPPVPLEDRAVMLMTCEQDITGLYFILPEAVSDGRARVELAGDRSAPMTLNWRDFGEGGVILAGRGLESIALIRSLAASKRLHVRVDYPKGPRAFVFEIDGLGGALLPLRRACHW